MSEKQNTVFGMSDEISDFFFFAVCFWLLALSRCKLAFLEETWNRGILVYSSCSVML